jgi:anti-sigma regulatory factor (Ser/Thr protein kinase)
VQAYASCQVTTIADEHVHGLACDRCGLREVGRKGVAEPESWIGERSLDAHLCPRCASEHPAWTSEDVSALRRDVRRALARSAVLLDESDALRALRPPARRPAIAVSLPARPNSVSTARRLLRVFAGGSTVSQDDLALLTSEVVSNALQHAGLREGDYVRIEAHQTRKGLRVSVYDGGPGIGDLPPCQRTESERGRGLAIVDRVASAWGGERGMVWFELS